MTLTLILIRHCKSDWSAGTSSDHARPLNPRGTRDAARLGAYLATQGPAPAAILCSNAQRTQDTLAGITAQLPSPPQATLRRDLYLAEPAAMLRALKTASAPTVALIAHNPGISALAWDLAQDPAPDPEFETYPTGALTVLSFDAPDWAQITQGRIRAFVTPRNLPDPS